MSISGNSNANNFPFLNAPISAEASESSHPSVSLDQTLNNNIQRSLSSPLAGSTPLSTRNIISSRINNRSTQQLSSNSQPELNHLQLQQQLEFNQQLHQLHRSPNQLSTLQGNNIFNINFNMNSNNSMDNEPSQNHINTSSFQSHSYNRDNKIDYKNNINSDNNNGNNNNNNTTSSNNINSISTCPYGCCHSPTIPEYLFINGLVKGNHYDVIIKAFGKKYKLHKIFLERSPYFKSLFSWSINSKNKINSLNKNDSESESDFGSASDSDSDNEDFNNYRKIYELPFDDLDETVLLHKQKSFELAISRLYGAINLKEEFKIPYTMIEMGQYLAISDIVCTSTDYIVKNMDMSNIAENLCFALNSDFGSASQRIIENGKGILSSSGWEKGPEAWDGIPTSIIAEIVGEDYFFVPTEWDRCIFIIKLIERLLDEKVQNFNNSKNNDILPLKKALNEKIHYCHMPPHQLQQLESLYDINGESYISSQVLHTALWQAVQLETTVTRAKDLSNLDNIIMSEEIPNNLNSWFKVPSKDETLSGLPKELDLLLDQSLSTTITNKIDSDDSKITQDEPNFGNSNKKLYNWTKIPPFRFSISFANVSELSTDKRVYGKIFWYAGSYWNLYLQKSYISSKNSYQVGVYLHRAHNGSSSSTSKSGLINPDIYANNINYQSSPKIYNNNLVSSFSPLRTKSWVNPESETINDTPIDELDLNINDLSIASDSKINTEQNKLKMNNKKQSIIHYEDHRSAIKVYFVIFTPSRRSAPTITSFLSVPNDFSKSQSWGWKSNNMCVFNEDGTFAEGQDPNLKFMILLGNV
jgi:hypothetical protein